MKPEDIKIDRTYADAPPLLKGREPYTRKVVRANRTYRDGELIRDTVTFVSLHAHPSSPYIRGREYTVSRAKFAKWAKWEILP